MKSLTVKELQTLYQLKFAELIDLHNSKNLNSLETTEYFQIREEWIKAGDALKDHINIIG